MLCGDSASDALRRLMPVQCCDGAVQRPLTLTKHLHGSALRAQ